jgi:hypothetical protein
MSEQADAFVAAWCFWQYGGTLNKMARNEMILVSTSSDQ